MNNKENLDTPPTCGTCRHFTVNPDTTPFTYPYLCARGQNAYTPIHPACGHYSPKQID